MPFKTWVHEDNGKWIAEVHRIGSNDPTTGEKVWWGAYDTKEEAQGKAGEVKREKEALEKWK
ncbi:MAG: hypothetical protein HYZ11_01760 [Candidatus Tectomicrobia bacterium]|uniref:AP2/ERF domain-containing protein n=1 Tax=Tectimicrobiota bacterium TaxID=2528274 RepID=A0A932HV90_UNCTE|nr:hypothetical protein [Candidatus Tectomicrobia bacterium]